MRKFARVVKSVYERDIEEKIDEESKAKKKGAEAQIAAISELKMSLNEELDDEDENKLVKQMKDDKSQFLKKFAIPSGVTNKDFDKALEGKGGNIPGVVSIPARKREAEDDSEALENAL